MGLLADENIQLHFSLRLTQDVFLVLKNTKSTHQSERVELD